ncbi:MAG: cyclic beta 1-2 glucan synthetase, partial [Verrucomicrobia bacterium]|nr:cyclic beta 1-2 glucan synthetase [Verrucomicrobiota bacterium]
MIGRMRTFTSPALRTPQVHLLSNGRYHVVLSHAGGGYSRYQELAVTRWREDATRDCWGTFIYVRDAATGEFWSTAYQPSLRETGSYAVSFTPGRVEYRQRQRDLEIQTQICVSAGDDAERRRVTLTNRSPAPRFIELTSYAEIVLAHPAADTAHPVFSNLFVQTEFAQPGAAILCTRRPRSETERFPCLFHLMAGSEAGAQGAISCETDRARFIGRGRTPVWPAAMQEMAPLSNTTGSVLDPIVSLRRTFEIAPGATVRVDYVLGVAENREAALGLSEKYRHAQTADQSFDFGSNYSEAILRQLDATESELQAYERLAGALIYVDPARRADGTTLVRNRRGQSALWSYGISGDLPIVLLRIRDPARLGLVQELIRAHAYWRMHGLGADLVLLHEDASGSHRSLEDQLIRLVASGPCAEMQDRPGGIFVRSLDRFPEQDHVLLQAAARVVLTDEVGTLAELPDRLEHPDVPVVALTPSSTRSAIRDTPPALASRELIFHNGL